MILKLNEPQNNLQLIQLKNGFVVVDLVAEIKEGDNCYYKPFGLGKATIVYDELCYVTLPIKNKGSLTQRLYQTKHLCFKIIFASQSLNLEGVKVIEEKDCWESVPVKWVKWTKEQPNWNGSVYLQFNGKNQGNGVVNNKQLLKLAGEDTKYHVEDGKIVADYSKQQLQMLDSVYWLKQDNDKVEYVEGLGYKQVKENTYTLEQVKKAFEVGRNYQLTGENNFTEFVNSLNLPKVEITFDENNQPLNCKLL